VQHVQQFGRLQLGQLPLEIMIRVGSRLQPLDPRLTFKKILDGVSNFFDARVRVHVGIAAVADHSRAPALLTLGTQEEKSNAPRARIGAQDFGQFPGIDKRQFNLCNDHIRPLGECGFESGGSVSGHAAGMPGARQSICDASAPTKIAVCDENSLSGHFSFDPDLDLPRPK
jgi:hypothetical protein